MENPLRLQDDRVLITGASGALGSVFARRLALEGADLALHYNSNSAAIERLADEIRALNRKVFTVKADLSTVDGAEALVDEARQALGGLDVLVNNASLRTHYPLQKLTLDKWREVLSINLDGPYLCARACINSMLKNGGGRIVNIGGASGHIGGSQRAHVITSKAGLVGLTKALAVEFGDKGITANIVVPGTIDADWDTIVKRADYPGGRETLVGRTGVPGEIAAAVRYLVSPEAAYVTGQAIHVNGGKYLP